MDREGLLGGRLWVTPGAINELHPEQRQMAHLLLHAYREEASLKGSPNPLSPELAPLRRLFRASGSA